MYPLAAVFLFVLPVIEQRYYFIPYALFLLFKEKDGTKTALGTLVFYIAASLILAGGIIGEKFFI